METFNIPDVGETILVTLPKIDPRFQTIYRVIRDDVQGDGRGTIELSCLKLITPNKEVQSFYKGERNIVVERNWFNTKITGREWKLLKVKNLSDFGKKMELL